MITSITIENFKGISTPVRLELRPITLLFGHNSAGKSSLLHAMIYAREVFERHNLDADRTFSAGEHLDLGGFSTLVHDHDLKNTLRLRFDLNLSQVDLPIYLPELPWLAADQYVEPNISSSVESAGVTIEIGWSVLRATAYVKRYAVEINGRSFAALRCEFDRREVILEEIDYLHPLLPPTGMVEELTEMFESGRGEVDFTRWGVSGQIDALPTWGEPLGLMMLTAPDFPERADATTARRMAKGMEGVIALVSRLVVGPGELLRDILRQFRYIGPQRQVPPRDYSPPRLPDPSRWANGMAGWDLLFIRPVLVERVSRLLSDPLRLNLGYTLEQVEFREFESRDRLLTALQTNSIDDIEDVDGLLKKARSRLKLLFRPIESPEVLLEPSDLGVGVSQMIPALAASLDDQPLGTATLPVQLVAIEHPELNLHPRLQAEIADVFLEGALAEATRGRIFFIETHSEAFTLRLFRRIRGSHNRKCGPLPGDGRGDGSGAGYGDGNGDGRGDGSGAGYGDGTGDGRGSGNLDGGFDLEVTPTDVGVWYVDRSSGVVTVKQILVDVEGEFVQPWPEKDTLFEQDFREKYS
jgi:AAA domain, putative AbiEii toxin, Type IV TA system/AAA ATPase domain